MGYLIRMVCLLALWVCFLSLSIENISASEDEVIEIQDMEEYITEHELDSALNEEHIQDDHAVSHRNKIKQIAHSLIMNDYILLFQKKWDLQNKLNNKKISRTEFAAKIKKYTRIFKIKYKKALKEAKKMK